MRQHFKVPHILNTNREYIQEYILLSFCRAVCRCPSSCNFESCVDVPNCSTSITWCLRSCIVWFIAVLTWCSATVYTVVRLMCPKLLLQRLVHQNLRCPIDTVCCSIKVSYTVPSRFRILFHQGFLCCSIKVSHTVLSRFRILFYQGFVYCSIKVSYTVLSTFRILFYQGFVYCSVKASYTVPSRFRILFHQGFVYCSIKGSYTVLPRFRTAPCRVCATLSQTEHVLSRFWPKTVQDQPNISTL